MKPEQALAAAQQQIQQLSSGSALAPSTGVIDTRTLGKPRTFTGQPAEWTTRQFTFKAFACATHARMRDVFELATRKGSDLVINSDMTVELQSLSTKLYYMLVMMLSDQALEIVRNSPQGVGAEVWRKLLLKYEPGVGIRYGAMLQSLLKRQFGEHDETDLAREIESFERDISKSEQQSSDLISDAIKHGIVCGGMAHQGLKHHIDLRISRLSTYKALLDEIINHSRARTPWTDPNAMQVDAVHVNVDQDRQVDGSGSQPDKGKSGRGGKCKSKKGGKGKERGEKAASEFERECRYCQKRRHKKADRRKMKSDIAAGKCDTSGKQIGGQCTLSGRRDAAFTASEPCTEHGEHHPVAADGASVLPESRRQSDVSTDGHVVHQHDRTGPEDSHGCKLGRSRIRVVVFWLNQICQRHLIVAATCKPAKLE